MTESQPDILSVESAHLRFDPSEPLAAGLARFYNDKYHAQGANPTLDSVASFRFYRINGGRIAPYPPAEPDIVEQATPLALRMSLFASLRLSPLSSHQMPLTSAFRMQRNPRGDVRLYFRTLPSNEDRHALTSLHDLRFPENDSSIELYAHIHALQLAMGAEALESARAGMVALLETGQLQGRGVSTYRAERTPLDRTKRLFVTGARLAQTAMLYQVPAPLAPTP